MKIIHEILSLAWFLFEALAHDAIRDVPEDTEGYPHEGILDVIGRHEIAVMTGTERRHTTDM